jgi:uncharacterized protein (TIGR03086 family)
MAVRIKSITFDCADPYRLARFWSQLTGFSEDPGNGNAPDDPEALLLSPDGSLALLFTAVPEPKHVKNRVHLDLVPLTSRRDEEVGQLLRTGARMVDDQRRPDGGGWVVLCDPEGNEFCIERSDAEREPMVGKLGRALDAVASLISNIRGGQWSAPTPCTDWNVRQVVNHLIGMNRVLAALLADQPPPPRLSADHAEDDPAGAYRDSAAALRAAFGRPGVLERAFHGPLGTATGAERLQIRLYDLLAHGWDLAQATGQPVDLPDDLAEQSLAFARTQLTGQARPGRFGPAQIVAEQAPAIERLVAFLGRPVNTGRRAMNDPANQGLVPARLHCGIVVRVREDACEVLTDGQLCSVRYATFFPSPRTERVSPGHLVAIATAPDRAAAVVWRWYDAVVLSEEASLIRLWEPSHGEVLARPRPARQSRQPGTRAYLSAGLPGADWWVAGGAAASAQDADVELDEVERFYTERDLWNAPASG